MKKFVVSIICVFVLSIFCGSSFAHPGRLDSNGGHHDWSDGSYHYHEGNSSGNNGSSDSKNDSYYSQHNYDSNNNDVTDSNNVNDESQKNKGENINELKSRPIKQENYMSEFITFALFTFGVMYFLGAWFAGNDVDFDFGTLVLTLFLFAATVMTACWTFNFYSAPYLVYVLFGSIVILPFLLGFIITKVKLMK